MEPVIGIFKTRAEAERAMSHLKSAGIPADRINLLTPGRYEMKPQSLPTTETEQPGMGEAMGGVVGGAVGAAGGMSLGAAAASIFVPGVGPVIAIGFVAAALLGAGGAVGGAIAGKALEEKMATGLPIDEMFVYEDALSQGRSVVIAFSDESEQADLAQKIMEQDGAESIDSARKNWWLGLRDVEEEHYAAKGQDFSSIEPNYRRGFEAALHPETRGKSYDDVINYLMANYQDIYREESFRHGYERGQAHYQALVEKRRNAARA